MTAWDTLDFALLRALSDDATQSAGALGRSLGLSQPAAWRRIKRLQREGVLAGRHIDLNAEALGFGVTVWAPFCAENTRWRTLPLAVAQVMFGSL